MIAKKRTSIFFIVGAITVENISQNKSESKFLIA